MNVELMRIVEKRMDGLRHIVAARWPIGQLVKHRDSATGYGVVTALLDDVSSGDPDHMVIRQAYRLQLDVPPPTEAEEAAGWIRQL